MEIFQKHLVMEWIKYIFFNCHPTVCQQLKQKAHLFGKQMRLFISNCYEKNLFSFHDQGHALPAADTQGGQAVSDVPFRHFIQQLVQNGTAAGRHRMP